MSWGISFTVDVNTFYSLIPILGLYPQEIMKVNIDFTSVVLYIYHREKTENKKTEVQLIRFIASSFVYPKMEYVLDKIIFLKTIVK